MKMRKCVRFVGGRGKMMSKRDNTGQSEIMLKVGEDLAELHLRREIERMADDVELAVKRDYDAYWVEDDDEAYDFQAWFGPYTLQQCHDKLREISNDT
jgi:hypothetical protein